MGLTITTDIDGDEQVIAQLDRALHALHDLSPAFEAIIPDFWDEERERFGAQPWAPLSPAYAKWKAQHYPGKGIMRLTDRLMDSLTSKSADAVVDVGPDHLTIGTRVPYAAKHHRGIGVPRRTLIEPSPGLDRKARRRLEHFIDHELNRGA